MTLLIEKKSNEHIENRECNFQFIYENMGEEKICCTLINPVKGHDPSCNLELCPMYQTWQILKIQNESLTML